jgi:hypothetical protein
VREKICRFIGEQFAKSLFTKNLNEGSWTDTNMLTNKSSKLSKVPNCAKDSPISWGTIHESSLTKNIYEGSWTNLIQSCPFLWRHYSQENQWNAIWSGNVTPPTDAPCSQHNDRLLFLSSLCSIEQFRDFWVPLENWRLVRHRVELVHGGGRPKTLKKLCDWNKQLNVPDPGPRLRSS